jgi:hypothetical protein
MMMPGTFEGGPPMGRSTVAIATLLALLSAGAASAAEIRALGGSYDEQVVAIREEGGRLVVKTPQRAIALDQVKSIRFQPPSAPRAERRGAKLLLTTGDTLRGQIQGGDETWVALSSQGLGDVRLRLDTHIRAVIFDATPERERALEASISPKQDVDSVKLRDGGGADGSVTVLDGTKIVVNTDIEGGTEIGTLQFDVAKVEFVSIVPFEKPPARPQGLRVVARLIDGSTLTGKIAGLSNDELRLTHPLGAQGELVIPLARVEELSVENGAFAYVSDLEPDGGVEQSFPPEFAYEVDVWTWKRDRNVEGGVLRLGGRSYEKGLGVHSYCRLVYRLDGAYREFRAVVGLDDSTRYMGEPGLGAVVFRVLLDGEKACKEYPNGIVQRKGQAPTEISVDVSGSRTLTLIVDYDPTSLHILGRANWADAHLIKR